MHLLSHLNYVLGYASNLFGPGKDISQPTDKPSIKRAEISTISLKVYSDDMRNIEKCIKKVEQAVENQYMKYTLSDYKELIKELKQEEVSFFQPLQKHAYTTSSHF